MSTGLHELREHELDDAVEDLLAPKLVRTLLSRAAGHCARVTELSAAQATGLCNRLRSAAGNRAQIYVLGSEPEVPASVGVTSTKLIELRNPDGDRLREPLLVFVPPGTKASAEDSFDIATFEEIAIGDVYRELTERLLAELTGELRHGIAELLAVLDDLEWPDARWLSKARYLLTVKLNDYDPEAAAAAVFELGLIPDFELFADTTEVRSRVARNAQQMAVLTAGDRPARQRVVELGLTDPAFRARLAEFLMRYDVHDPYEWTRRIVVDRANWTLAFQRWPLRREHPDDVRIRIRVYEPALAIAGDGHDSHPVLDAIVGQLYLPVGKSRISLAVQFDVDPDPGSVPGLERFGIQVMSESMGATGARTSVRVGKRTKTRYKAVVKNLSSENLEQGWHYLRILPLDFDGLPLPVDADRTGPHPPNESERFYVLDDGTLDEPPARTTATKDVGVTHALRRMEFEALLDDRPSAHPAVRSIAWRDDGSALRAWMGPNVHIDIPVSEPLAEIERGLLARPEHPVRWRVALHAGTTELSTAIDDPWPGDSDPVDHFLAARTEVFAAIRGDDEMVVEGCDVGLHREAITAYAESYYKLLRWQLLRAERADEPSLAARLGELAAMLRIDTAVVDHRDVHGNRTELTLVAPTHPLRLLWLATWSELGQRWRDAAHGIEPGVAVATAASHAALRPLGFPLTVPRDGGRMAVAAADLTPYWGVCLPMDVIDPRGVLSELVTALGGIDRGPETRSADPASGKRLADRVERYLRLHPYVGTIVIAAVNAGGAEPLADLVIDLQQRKGFQDLTYEITLFSSVPESPVEGLALARLLRGEWRDTVAAEAFHTRRTSGLAPKLAVAIRPIDEFRSASATNRTHLCFLFDAFEGEDFGAASAAGRAPIAVHGLVQSVDVDYLDNGDTVAWRKSPRHGSAAALAHAEELTDVLSVLPEMISHAVSAVATGQAGVRMSPVMTLSLSVADSTLLHQAHQSSDWVITVDRTLGVEYFDNPFGTRRSDYVLDVEDGVAGGLGHHVVVTSRSMDELCALLMPVMEQHKLSLDSRHARTFFDQLRLLSGRLALKIASATPNQRTEVLGLALARLFLDYQGVLADQILVPLDAHLELYRDARNADLVGESVGLQRTDLALFSLDARRRTITCRLVEVKCRSSLSLTRYEELKTQIIDQLNQSAEVLARHFDPLRTQPDRPDRPVRNAKLAGLLRFYLGRAERHRVVGAQVATEARWLLDRLDRDPGYRLEFVRTGLIFDLAGSGVQPGRAGGVDFYVVGRDMMEELLGAIPTTIPSAAAEPATSALADLELTVPRLDAAGFRAPVRDHDLGDDYEAAPDSEVHEIADSRPSAPAPDTAVPHTSPEPAQGDDVLARQHTPPPAENAGSAQSNELPVLLGTSRPSPQFGIIGETSLGSKVALDLNETHTISLFGVQGGGKSYTLGTIIEAASLSRPPLNELPRPLATIVFHYSPTLDYAPEFTSMVRPNTDPDQMEILRDRYGVTPAGLADVLMLVPEDQLAQRRSEHPGIEVLPLKFSSAELRAADWRFLMGAIGNQSTYIRQLQRIMKAHRHDLRLETIRAGIDGSGLPDNLKELAHQRLDLAAEYIDDTVRVKDFVRPGRMIIVDLRDEFIEKDEALGLFVVLMQLFAEAQDSERPFNKLVVFDEAHKYIESPDLVAGLVDSVREMRHKGMSVLVASQDPPSVPIALIELSSQVILHKFTSPAWLKHLLKANSTLGDLTSAKMAALVQGDAYIWSSKATDDGFTKGALPVRMRPRLSLHGGGTKTAVHRS